MRRRFFTGCADLAILSGFTRPQNHGCRNPLDGDGAFVRLYTFSRSTHEAQTRFMDYLTEHQYKVLELTEVAPNGSNKPWPMDDMFLMEEDIVKARQNGSVVLGWFMGYANT